MAVAVWKGIKPSTLKIDAFRLESLNAMRKTGTKIRRDYNKTTATWKGETPDFEETISLTAPGPTLVVGPAGSQHGADKWRWLDEGTAVRYATMSPDFSRKTTPNVVGSSSGSGGVIYVRKDRPMPGIEARNWTKILIQLWTEPFKRDQEEALKSARKKSGHSI